MVDWTETDEVPDCGRSGRRRTLFLEPGQKMWRPLPKAAGNGYDRSFKRQGLTDYHARVVTVNGERRLYIWRDEVAK